MICQVAAFQGLGILGLLVPTLFNIKQIQANDEDPHKAMKIWMETLTFVLFETWRLVLAFDGVYCKNEFKNNSCICIIHNVFSSFQFNEFGWEVYKKIGGSVELQHIFFEFIFLLLLFSGAIQHQVNIFTFISGSMVPFCLLSILIGRLSLSRESHIMMTLFILSQMIILAYLVNFIICSFKHGNGTYLLGWYAYFSFVLCAIIASLFTLYFAFMCQMNFGKKLKDHVQWGFTMKKQRYSTNMDDDSFEKRMSIEPPLKMNIPIDD
ncbi:hypothetical protein K501DRAFT_269824 [Backusella circina FSU 941]|nr:hypothetical protein K501DRAFT_269824 [Backusella circina FSU 941]